MNKNIIVVGAMAVGLYLLSQANKPKKQKSTDLGYSKKKTTEEKKKANEAWDKIVNDVRGPFLKPIYTMSPTKQKKKKTFNKSKLLKTITKKKNKI